nr:hypothetical protein [Tanacetum cinerariifolium]
MFKPNNVNEEAHIQALVDKKKVIITEASIRGDLRFEDERGVDCLSNEVIFEQLTLMGSTMAFIIICLATNQNFNFSKYIFNNMVKHLDGGVKFLMYPRFVQVFLDNQVEGMDRHNAIFVISSHKKKVFANMKREGKDFSENVTPLFQTMMKQKSRRKQRKEIEVSSQSSEIPNEEGVPITSNDLLLSGEDRIQLNELMILCTNLQKQVLNLEEAKTAQAKEIASLKKRVKKLEQKRKSRTSGLKRLRKVRSARRVESLTEASLGDQEDALKQGRMIENIDQDVEITLVDYTQGRMNEEDMFRVNFLDGDEVVVDVSASEKVKQSVKVVEKEVSTADPVITAGETLIEIKAAKPKVITTVTATGTRPKEKGKAKMIEPEKPLKRKDHIMMDAEVAKNLEAQMQAELEEEVSEKAEEGSSKRAASNLEQEDAKRQRIEEENESAELKRCLEIILEDDDVKIKATPLSSKSLTMFKNFNIEDLEVLWSIVKTRFKKTKTIDNMDNLLFETLKTMFEHHVEDNIWKYQQGTTKVLNWKNFDACGVYCVTTKNMVYYLLVEKMYPFTRNILHQMWNDVRLRVDYEVEMAYDLLRLIRRQINEGYVPE